MRVCILYQEPMPMGDPHNLQLGGAGCTRHEDVGQLTDVASTCLIGDCVDLLWAWVLAFIPRLLNHVFLFNMCTILMTNSRDSRPNTGSCVPVNCEPRPGHTHGRAYTFVNLATRLSWCPAIQVLTDPSGWCPRYIMSFQRSIYPIFAK